jgi:hypothetical protein
METLSSCKTWHQIFSLNDENDSGKTGLCFSCSAILRIIWHLPLHFIAGFALLMHCLA